MPTTLPMRDRSPNLSQYNNMLRTFAGFIVSCPQPN
jgi:hypothetical protein